MAQVSESFLKILQDDSPVTFDNESSASLLHSQTSVTWDDDESFEVSEVPNPASTDVTLAEALRSIDGNETSVTENPQLTDVTYFKALHTIEGVHVQAVNETSAPENPRTMYASPTTSDVTTSVDLQTIDRCHMQARNEHSPLENPQTRSTFNDVTLAKVLQTNDMHSGNVISVPKSPQNQPKSESYSKNNLKAGLRSKIQTRRRSEGIGELSVEFESPKSYPLSAEENEKVERRKRRNRLSANRSRLKRKSQEESLQKEVAELETVNNKLLREIKVLKKFKSLLTSKIISHPCFKMQKKAS